MFLDVANALLVDYVNICVNFFTIYIFSLYLIVDFITKVLIRKVLVCFTKIIIIIIKASTRGLQVQYILDFRNSLPIYNV